MVKSGKQVAVFSALGLALACAACHHKQADTTPSDDTPTTTTTSSTAEPAHDESGNMVPPEKIDEVTQALKRKEMIVSHCMASAMETGGVPRGTHGSVRFEVKIGTDGHATDVSVAQTNITAQPVLDCAKKHVMETEFPALPVPFETSYNYAMEAN